MIAPIASLVPDLRDRILCYYVNTTATLQTAFILGIPESFERIIFPQQRLLFEAPLDATLELRTCSSTGEMVIVHIPCLQLQVNQRDLLNTTTLENIFDPVTQTDLKEE